MMELRPPTHHGLSDQHRHAQVLQLLFAVGLHVVGQVGDGDVVDAELTVRVTLWPSRTVRPATGDCL